MKVWRLLIYALAALAPLCSKACDPATPDSNQALKATFIAQGTAEGSHWIEPSTLLVRIAVVKVIKGSSPSVIEAASPCALPVKDGETVIVFNSEGRTLVYPTKIYGQDLNAALIDVHQ